MWRLAASLMIAIPTGACSDGCANTVLASREAPGGRLRATLFQRDCGATTGFSTQISVLTVGARPIGRGNAFVADDNHGAAEAGPGGGPWAEATWLADDRLLIRYDARSRVFAQRAETGGVRITYQPVVR